MSTVAEYLDRCLDPVADALTPEVAAAILQLQADSQLVERVRQLGEKCNAGELTASERREYEALADAGSLIALLKAKARRCIARESAGA